MALSVTLAPPAYRARELVEGYAEAAQGVTWVVGGPASEELREIIEGSGGIVVGKKSLEDARTVVTKAMRDTKKKSSRSRKTRH